MKYENIIEGIFLERRNRFVAEVLVEGKPAICHVKNTGRCKELLVEGATLYLEDHRQRMGTRKLPFSVIGVIKENARPGEEREGLPPGGLLVNMDSMAPNVIVEEGLRHGTIRLPGFTAEGMTIQRERTYGRSRLDFYLEEGKRRAYLEVKGVTLEEGGISMFPDAPTERGVKHVEELMAARREGFDAFVIFVLQMEGIREFRPNDRMHLQFGEALRQGEAAGVIPLAYDCRVTRNSLHICGRVPVNTHKML